jgi:hypothetical protein
MFNDGHFSTCEDGHFSSFYETREFAKTGSGQTHRKLRNRETLFAGYFNPSRTDAQQQLYNGWSESLPPDTKLVVVEIGVGTVRRPSSFNLRISPRNLMLNRLHVIEFQSM